MKNVLLDLRGRALRALVTDGETVTYLKSFETFSLDDPEHAKGILSDIAREAGIKFDRVHCIMPSEDVSAATFSIPVMSLSDAEKVIHRKLSKESGLSSPIFRILPTGFGGDKQSYLVETVKRETIERYLDFFNDQKISVKTISTSLHTNLKATSKTGDDLTQTTGVLDIGSDIIEMTVISSNHVISYGKAVIPHLDVEKERLSGKSEERIHKMKVYRIVEALYNAQTDYKKDYPDIPISKMFICGTGGALAGIHEALHESMNLTATSLNTLSGSVADGYQYTALHGFALGLLDGTAVNYLPRDMSTKLPFSNLGNKTVISAAAIYALMLITVVTVFESKLVSAQKNLWDKTRTKQDQSFDSGETAVYAKHSGYLNGLLSRQISWQTTFGYLADNTPDGVYLEGVSLKPQQSTQMLEISFVTPHPSEVGGKKFLTRIVSMIDKCGALRRNGEPIISTSKNDKKGKLLHIKVLCEVL